MQLSRAGPRRRVERLLPRARTHHQKQGGPCTSRPALAERQATKQAPHRSRAIEKRIGENPCEVGSWGVCLAFQSHFRILACGSVAGYARSYARTRRPAICSGHSGQSSWVPHDRPRCKYKVGLVARGRLGKSVVLLNSAPARSPPTPFLGAFSVPGRTGNRRHTNCRERDMHP